MSNEVCGADIGTMFFQTAKRGDEGNTVIDIIRNSFVELEATEDVEEVLKQNSWRYVKDEDKYYILGDDAMKVAQMFPGKIELRRPMADGVLNKNEEKKMLILSELINSGVGKADSPDSVVCACVSSPSVDESQDSTFHKARLSGIMSRLGYTVKIIDEGLAVVLSEKPVMVEEQDGKQVDSPYSGIGISFGAGRVNCVLAYKGLQVIGMSAARSGDWIDKKVAENTGKPISQVTNMKEKKLDFNKVFECEDDDSEVLLALDAYYTSMLEYVFSKFGQKFAEVKSKFDAPLDVILAGGTSMPKGFCEKVKTVISGMELPFKVREVRMASDPRNTVVKGCLVQAIISQKRLKQERTQQEDQKLPKIS